MIFHSLYLHKIEAIEGLTTNKGEIPMALKKSTIKNVKKDVSITANKEFNEKSRKIVVKDFSYRMKRGLYNALAAEPKSKEPVKGAWKQRHRFDAVVLAALNAENRGRKIVSLIVD